MYFSLNNTKHFAGKLLAVISCMTLIYDSTAQTFSSVAYFHNIFHQYSGGEYGGGVSFCDFDNDGLDDLTFANKGGPPSLYKNTGTTFIQLNPMIQNNHDVKQLNWVDYDNDGDRDLFYCNLKGPYKLYNNDGNMNLTDVSVAAGFPVTDYETYGNSWSDYDRDGDLDVYISNYNGIGFGDPTIGNFLYRNNGNGTFTDVTAEAGVGNGVNYTFQGIWMDYNNDLWPDLFVVNDRYNSRNFLYQNNGNGTFTDVTFSAALADYIFAMGVSTSDYDHDGDLDFYITNGTDGNHLKRNEGNLTYTNQATATGSVLNLFCWGAQFTDYDNDTWDDLFVCSTPFMATNGQNRLLHNDGGVFSNATPQSGIHTELAWSYSNAVGDIDSDGYADLVVLNGYSNYSSLWLNNQSGNNWMTVDLKGTVSNIDGISSWIHCYAGGKMFPKFTMNGEGYISQNSHREFFGMGTYTQVDSLRVLWPSGIVDTWYNIPVNQHLKLVEGEGRKAVLSTSGNIELCNGESILLDAGEWTGYQWNNSLQTSQISTSSQGIYYSLVEDEFGNNFYTDSLILTLNPIPQYELITDHPDCFGDQNGSVMIIPSELNEAAFAEVSWPDQLMVGDVLNDLSTGSYPFKIQSDKNCLNTGIADIIEPDEFLFTHIQGDVRCFGENSGFFNTELFGGTPPYFIDWNSINPDSLYAGDYTIHMSDSNGCSVSHQFTIEQPEALLSDIEITNAIEGIQPGSAAIVIGGGTQPYSITWSNGEENTQQIGDLDAGNYSVSVIDANQCTNTIEFEIETIIKVEDHTINGWQIYPNPADDYILSDFNAPDAGYQIIDCSGKMVLAGKLRSSPTRIETTTLAPGYYIIRVMDAGSSQCAGFIKN